MHLAMLGIVQVVLEVRTPSKSHRARSMKQQQMSEVGGTGKRYVHRRTPINSQRVIVGGGGDLLAMNSEQADPSLP